MSRASDGSGKVGERSPPGAAPGPTRTNVDATGVLAAGTLLARRYRITSLVGVGGMGVVYRARDEELGLDVALKVLRPELAGRSDILARFRRELVLARAVTHPNVVRIHDIAEHEGISFLTMDFVVGRSLRTILEREGPLGVDRATAIVRQLAAALEEAHRKGVVHRDLKPENVLVDEADQVYITDFGVARSLGGSGLTRTGAVLGTLDYLSPEQARGEEVDGRSDIYALGILFFEMLSGQLPFAGGSHAEILAQRISGTPRDLRDLHVEAPPIVSGAIRRCLERNPARRFQHAAEVVDALEGRQPVRRRARPLGPAAVVVGLMVATLVLAWFLVRSPQAARGSRAPTGALAKHTLAVLPLVDQTGRPDLAWTSAGVAETLAAGLAESPSLAVVNSLRVFRTLSDLNLAPAALGPAEARQLGELLDTDRLVTGHVRLLGARIVVDVAMWGAGAAPAPSATHAESGTIIELPTVVARLGDALRKEMEIAASPEPPVPATLPAAAVEAYGAGVACLARGDFVHAAPLFERAVQADGSFAAAWVRLSEAYHNLGFDDRARDAAARAAATLQGSNRRIALEARASERGAPGRRPRDGAEVPRVAAAPLPERHGGAGRLGRVAGPAGQARRRPRRAAGGRAA